MKKIGLLREFSVFTLWSVLLWGATIVVVVVLHLSSLYMGELNQDEGWYLYAAKLVSQGSIPYRDFVFTQGPIMPFVYSWAWPMVERWGVLGGRLYTMALGFLSMFLSAWLAFRMSSPRRRSAILNRQSCAAMLTVILIGINAYQAYFTSVVKTYSLTSLLLVSGFLLLSYAEGRRGWLCAFLSGVLFALATGVRSSVGIVIPVVAVLLLWCFFYSRKIRRTEYDTHDAKKEKIIPDHVITPILPFGRGSVVSGFIIGAGVALIAVFLPFFLLAPEGFLFGLFEYHIGRQVGGLMMMLMLKGGSALRLLAAYFVPFSLLIIISLYVLFHRSTFSPSRVPRNLFILVVVALSALAVAIVQILPAFPYDDYQVNVFPLFAVALAVYLSWVMAPELMHICAAVFFLSVAAVVSSPQISGWFVTGKDRLWVRMREKPQVEVLRQVARNIKDLSGKSSEILTQDTYLAVETGLDVPHGMELGPFSYVPDWPRDRAERCNLVNREMLTEIIEQSEAPVAAVSGYGFSVKVPAVTELSEVERYFLQETLEKKYKIFREVDPFGQADTKLRVYVRK